VYRVFPTTSDWHRTDDWCVERDGLIRSVQRVKGDALHVARLFALATRPSRVVVERADGSIETEAYYGPRPARAVALRDAV
jgi:hypothetical protein